MLHLTLMKAELADSGSAKGAFLCLWGMFVWSVVCMIQLYYSYKNAYLYAVICYCCVYVCVCVCVSVCVQVARWQQCTV